MSQDTPEPNVLRRMLAASSSPPPRREGGGGVLRRLALALCRAMQEVAGLAITISGQQQGVHDLDGVEKEAQAPEHALITLVEAPGGAAGLVVVSAPVVGAVVARRMTGRVPAALPASRAPTRTDGEMLRDVIDGFLAHAAEAGPWLAGYGYRGMLSDARLARFTLTDGLYHSVRLDVALPGGLGEGEILLLLPQHEARQPVTEAGQGWSRAVSDRVMGAAMPLQAVLTRLQVPYARALRLAPGDVLTIPVAAIDSLSLEGAGGAVVATGRLGQSRGDRAVRISQAGLSGKRTAPPAMAGGAEEEGFDSPQNTPPPALEA
ncbi:FliM/FliN family flagellar motor switch protein [Actibacterium sp. XHP0104]|uniref:FliM/FliN family flagellar motor switch protein n=1 Tax=Actibacterium sp. XHP0104 TaxID=2984335 RepID=UPI0021E771EF|nr:FliM/FliN family flagellar motor switch protein [Actibacterium sp. XHP0104]MCV2880663.1 FliM/FliN family flagellar motor switch protein [Actibacterium sp. XHP0104]